MDFDIPPPARIGGKAMSAETEKVLALPAPDGDRIASELFEGRLGETHASIIQRTVQRARSICRLRDWPRKFSIRRIVVNGRNAVRVWRVE